MYILVLDAIHGGLEIAHHLENLGHKCDVVDIYRHECGISEETAKKNVQTKIYDLIIAPVHTSPDYTLLNCSNTPVISHHKAVGMIIDGSFCGGFEDKNNKKAIEKIPDSECKNKISGRKPHLSIEITGARGKTTTAFALTYVLPKKGILHTSKGTVKIPEDEILYKKSITPASVIDPALLAFNEERWLICEESLGVAGFSDICILTSSEDYPIAGKKKSALDEKIKSLKECRKVLLAPGVSKTVKSCMKNAVSAEDFVSLDGDKCSYSYYDEDGINIKGFFSNPLLLIEGYKEALITAAALGCILGKNPARLFNFIPVEGRMSVSKDGQRLIIDNSNSGANKMTAVMAAFHARKLSGKKSNQISDNISDDKSDEKSKKLELTLVIGVEAENICEGFSLDDVSFAINEIKPQCAIIVGDSLKDLNDKNFSDIPIYFEKDLKSGHKKAIDVTEDSDLNSIVLCVKTWR